MESSKWNHGDNNLEYQWEMDEEDDKGGIIDEPESDIDNVALQATGAGTGDGNNNESVPGESDAEATGSTVNTTSSANPGPGPSHKPYIEHLSCSHPGVPLRGKISKHGYQLYQDDLQASGDAGNPWAPFNSKMDWEIACWAKLCGPGSTAVSELLSINSMSIVSHSLYHTT